MVLVKLFCSEEVKATVWDFASFKCPGPDGVNFGFIKDFWDDMNADIIRFVTDFHRNGKLLKRYKEYFHYSNPKKG